MDWYHYGDNGFSAITHFLDGKSPEELENIKNLYDNYYRCCRNLLSGTIESFPEAYFATLGAARALDEAVGNEPDWTPERDLARLLDAASDTWHIGETQEMGYTFSPWPQDDQEPDMDEEDNGELGHQEDGYIAED